MPCSCCAVGLNEIFNDRIARHEARRFLRRGLPRRSRKLLAAITRSMSLAGADSLEVGAGIGAITITLLRAGESRARIVDAAPAYVAAARRLAAECGVADHLDIELADYAAWETTDVMVDLIVMDRVVCCYPAWLELLQPASRQARKIIALTYPRTAWWTRFGVAAVNQLQRMRRMSFRVYVHSPAAMHEALRRLGFSTRVEGHHGPWEILVATRTGQA